MGDDGAALGDGVAVAPVEPVGALVLGKNLHAEFAAAGRAGARLGDGQQGGADAVAAPGFENRQGVHVVAAGDPVFEFHQRAQQRRDVGQTGNVLGAGLGEAIGEQHAGDLAVEMGDHGVAVGEAGVFPRGALGTDIQRRAPVARLLRPEIAGDALAGDLDELRQRPCIVLARVAVSRQERGH
jgi:hypothetical protein